jgi:hypothetical protein
MEEKWVAIVYDYGEKIASRWFTGEEAKAESEASKWVKDNFGEGKDWSLHRVISE